MRFRRALLLVALIAAGLAIGFVGAAEAQDPWGYACNKDCGTKTVTVGIRMGVCNGQYGNYCYWSDCSTGPSCPFGGACYDPYADWNTDHCFVWYCPCDLYS